MKNVKLILDMPEDDYHAIPALSASGIKLLNTGPLDYWHKIYGPGKSESGTRAQMNGSAKHKAALEGVEKLREKYTPALDKTMFDDVLDSHDDLKTWCKRHDLKVGGTKKVLCERIAEYCESSGINTPALWPTLTQDYAADATDSGKTILTQNEYADALEKSKQSAQIVGPLRDSGGHPEVTILWEDGGISCKARLDFLAPGIVLDLKNVANKNCVPFRECCHSEIGRRMMTVQAEWYLRAARIAQGAKLLPFDYDGDFTFQWLFMQSSGTPNILVRDYEQKKEDIERPGKFVRTDISTRSASVITDAISAYSHFMSKFGTDTPWVTELDHAAMRDVDYPSWYLYDPGEAEIEFD